MNFKMMTDAQLIGIWEHNVYLDDSEWIAFFLELEKRQIILD